MKINQKIGISAWGTNKFYFFMISNVENRKGGFLTLCYGTGVVARTFRTSSNMVLAKTNSMIYT